MYEPGFNQGGYEARVKQKQKESVIAVAEPDEKPAEDYNEKIAGELFKKDMSPVTVELLEPRTGVRVMSGSRCRFCCRKTKIRRPNGTTAAMS